MKAQGKVSLDPQVVHRDAHVSDRWRKQPLCLSNGNGNAPEFENGMKIWSAGHRLTLERVPHKSAAKESWQPAGDCKMQRNQSIQS